LNSWWIKIRDFLNEQFQTDEFTDVYKAMKVAKWAEKIETDANFVDWKNAFMLAWTEKVKIELRLKVSAKIMSESNMSRLNSGNFGIFYPDGFYLNLNSSLESALKIIQNDIDIAYEL